MVYVKISVVTTCYNAADTILGCLESVRRQTHADVEHILVDAASTDGTLSLLGGSAGQGVRVISEPDKGMYDGMNKGLQLASGEVVGILNADDMYYSPNVLAQVAQVFEDATVECCYGDLVYITAEGTRAQYRDGQPPSQADLLGQRERSVVMGADTRCKVLRYWRAGEFDYRKFWWGWMPPHPTFFVRRQVYEKCGYFNLAMGTAADYELMLRFLVRHRLSCRYIPDILVKMRSGGASNVTLRARVKANLMDRQAWEMNGLRPYSWTLLLKPFRKVGQWFSKPSVLK